MGTVDLRQQKWGQLTSDYQIEDSCSQISKMPNLI